MIRQLCEDCNNPFRADMLQEAEHADGSYILMCRNCRIKNSEIIQDRENEEDSDDSFEE